MSDNLPLYDDLPAGPIGGRLAWGVFGPDDELGLLNLQTSERRAAAAALVRTGKTFRLDLPLDAIDPPLNPNRRPLRHRVLRQPNIGYDDAVEELFPQAGSQWDSLSHVGYTRAEYYNGRTPAEIEGDGRNSVARTAERGVVGRGILLDVERVLQRRDPGYRPDSRVEIGVDVLEEARIDAKVAWQPGDTILLHTGYTRWYADQHAGVRAGLPGHVVTAGLAQSEDVVRYLWNSRVSAVAADNFAVEAWPADTSESAQPWGFIHQLLIGSLGLALGELWWLAELADDCRQDGVHVGMLVAAPLYVEGGISSPANALFLK